VRGTARALKLSRNAVRRILRSGQAEVPQRAGPDQTDPHLPLVRELFARCQGNRVRVAEELQARQIVIPYSTLTAGLRRLGIGVEVKQPAGQYIFAPGVEMQHDTSPHDLVLGGQRRRVQTASLVLGFSRMRLLQCYPTWNRFWCKVFLTDALVFLGGAASRCIIDNSSVVIARGTGKVAIMAPEMESFGTRFGFTFFAHEVGDANRSGKVERPFHHFEHNFLAGRTFTDWDDLNAQARAWCERIAGEFRKRLRARPVELWTAERPALQPLPAYVPDVYMLDSRIVDIEGYINLYGNRYSAPSPLLGRSVEVRAYKDRVVLYDGKRQVAEHRRVEDGQGARVTNPEHRRPRRKPGEAHPLLPEEQVLRAAGTEIARLGELVKFRHGARGLRKLHRLYMDYPDEAFAKAAATAVAFGLHDLDRIERLVLRTVRSAYFRLPTFDLEGDLDPALESDHGRQPRPAPAQPQAAQNSADPGRRGQEGDEGEGEL
jgi:Mu transposase, C-terminal domain